MCDDSGWISGSSCCLSVIKFTQAPLPLISKCCSSNGLIYDDALQFVMFVLGFHPSLADEAWHNKSPCPGSRVLGVLVVLAQWQPNTHTHTWAERRDLKINLRKVSPTQISHLSHFVSCALNLYLYLLFNFAPLLCILAHFYARLPPRSFAALTAKFNFYCCLTLLNDFYCLSAGPPRSSEERRSLCRNLI